MDLHLIKYLRSYFYLIFQVVKKAKGKFMNTEHQIRINERGNFITKNKHVGL